MKFKSIKIKQIFILFLTIIIYCSCENSFAILIEDSDNGVKAANDAGIFVVGYKNPLVEDQTLENADIIVESFDELKDHI